MPIYQKQETLGIDLCERTINKKRNAGAGTETEKRKQGIFRKTHRISNKHCQPNFRGRVECRPGTVSMAIETGSSPRYNDPQLSKISMIQSLTYGFIEKQRPICIRLVELSQLDIGL
jgi:hypothetical protein